MSTDDIHDTLELQRLTLLALRFLLAVGFAASTFGLLYGGLNVPTTVALTVCWVGLVLTFIR